MDLCWILRFQFAGFVDESKVMSGTVKASYAAGQRQFGWLTSQVYLVVLSGDPQAFLQSQVINIKLYAQPDEPLRIAFWLTTPPPGVFPVSRGCPLLLTAFEKTFSSVRQEDEGEPVRLQSLSASGIMSENLFCFFHLTPLLSFSASPSPLPICRNRYKLSGVWWCRISKLSWKSGALWFY